MLLRQDGYKQVFGARDIDSWMSQQQKLYRDYLCSTDSNPKKYYPAFRFFEERFEVFTLSVHNKLTHAELLDKIQYWEKILRVVNDRQLDRTDKIRFKSPVGSF
jgi:hypothetical protein